MNAVTLDVDSWWDEPEYKEASRSLLTTGAFILDKLKQRDAVRFNDVIADLYRDQVPEPWDITKFEWHTILAYIGASEGEIKDVQLRMGRVWR
jgi:hypothetical protein